MRKAFADTLTHVAAQNPRVILLTGDLGFQVFDEFHARFGPRYVNVGIAEAQMITAAAGLALEGWRPVAYSIASFVTARAFEQIRISVDYPNLPVVVAGAGGGYTYASSGVTHHSADDICLMSALPMMTVVAPGDSNEVAQLLPQVFQLAGPSYFRVGRYGEATYHADEPAVLGRARFLRDGERIAVVSTGDMASVVLQAVTILNSEGIYPIVYQMHTVKPLDTDSLDRLAGRVDTIITVEEHVPVGGLSAAVKAWRASRQTGPRVERIGPPDSLALGNLKREELRRRFKYDAESIAEACRFASRASPSEPRTLLRNIQNHRGQSI
jgi:transketolase